MPEIDVADLFDRAVALRPEGRVRLMRRVLVEVDCAGAQLDISDTGRANCLFLRVPRSPGAEVTLTLTGQFQLLTCPAGGWLLKPSEHAQPAYWVPCLPQLRELDEQGHILAESNTQLARLETGDGFFHAGFAGSSGLLDAVVWQFRDEAWVDQLFDITALEAQAWFLWGSHTLYTRPADVYAHLIHGNVYERGFAWPHKRKICSENDAHALFVTLCGLERATGKTLYRLLKAQLLLSVLARQGADGGFRHGEWSADMESHYRLHVSGMHLMMDALAEDVSDIGTRAALTKAADFVAAKTDTLDSGTWFLHDELETDNATMALAPFRWIASRALGKRESNMLVLNTQLDTSVALHRFGAVTGDSSHTTAVGSAQSAALAVLALRPAETLYRSVFWVVGLTLLPAAQAAQLPAWQRAIKRLGWKYLLPRLPDLKARFPRLVMPGGYVDRELVLRTWAHHYLSINLMDLTRYQRRMPSPQVERVIREGAAFAHDSGILQRWTELKYERYALGFWAEALYHVCTLFPERHYRVWLAEAMQMLEDLKMGQPPSLLGANAEAVPVADQLPCPSPADARLRVANLGRRSAPELMVLNPSNEAIPLRWESAPPPGLRWQLVDGSELVGEASVPARAWAWSGLGH